MARSKRVTSRPQVGLVLKLGEGQEPGLRAAVTLLRRNRVP